MGNGLRRLRTTRLAPAHPEALPIRRRQSSTFVHNHGPWPLAHREGPSGQSWTRARATISGGLDNLLSLVQILVGNKFRKRVIMAKISDQFAGCVGTGRVDIGHITYGKGTWGTIPGRGTLGGALVVWSMEICWTTNSTRHPLMSSIRTATDSTSTMSLASTTGG